MFIIIGTRRVKITREPLSVNENNCGGSVWYSRAICHSKNNKNKNKQKTQSETETLEASHFSLTPSHVLINRKPIYHLTDRLHIVFISFPPFLRKNLFKHLIHIVNCYSLPEACYVFLFLMGFCCCCLFFFLRTMSADTSHAEHQRSHGVDHAS